MAPEQTMSGHPQFEEDFELYALGALDGDEKSALDRHLFACAECRARMEGARGRMSMLALSAPSVAPPDGVRERLIEQFRAEGPRESSDEPLVRSKVMQFRRSLWAPLWAAAAVLLLAAAAWFAVENRRLGAELAQLETTHQQLEESEQRLQAQTARAAAALDILTAPETVKVELTPVAARPVPHGKAFYNPSRGLLFYAANLRALPDDRIYELWLIPSEGAPIDAGIFNSDVRGNGEVILPALPPGLIAKAFAVTVERAGGVPAPTGPKVLIGPVS
ncbi:MAG TPA: anti-sigma factor [Terriglobia bacterium]|nr:anti-sigma factor [Terriglobia bacterium]